MDQSKWGVHASHCCLKHGCKYGKDDCPVVNQQVVQQYTCEWCSESGIDSVTEMTRQHKLEQPGQVKVEISVEPDEEMAQQGTPYSWCLLRYNSEPDAWEYSSWKVVSSGWAETHEKAYREACESLKTLKEKKV